MFLILHIPHSSSEIPSDVRNQFNLSDAELEDQIRRMTDTYTDDLFPKDYERLVFPVSRLVCDPERFSDDSEEPMAQKGMGAVYQKGYQGTVIRTCPDVKEVLRRWYYPHHHALDQAVSKALISHGCCTIIDCHSFSPSPLFYEDDKRPIRPEICIGVDNYHTPSYLKSMALEFFAERNFTVALNRPYSGALVPISYYQKDKRVQSLMIEVNRGLYMNGKIQKTNEYDELKGALKDFCGKIAEMD